MFEWDERKSAATFELRGIDFEIASYIWDGPRTEKIDDRKDYGEVRYVTFGAVDDQVLAVVYTMRNDVIRIISARKANRDEREAYFAEVARRSSQGD